MVCQWWWVSFFKKIRWHSANLKNLQVRWITLIASSKKIHSKITVKLSRSYCPLTTLNFFFFTALFGCHDEAINLASTFVTMEWPEHAKAAFHQFLGWLAIGTLCILLWITISRSCQHSYIPLHLMTWILTMAKTIQDPTKQPKVCRRYTIPFLTVCHLFYPFFVLISTMTVFTRRTMWFPRKRSTSWYSPSTLRLAWGRWFSTQWLGTLLQLRSIWDRWFHIQTKPDAWGTNWCPIWLVGC